MESKHLHAGCPNHSKVSTPCEVLSLSRFSSHGSASLLWQESLARLPPEGASAEAAGEAAVPQVCMRHFAHAFTAVAPSVSSKVRPSVQALTIAHSSMGVRASETVRHGSMGVRASENVRHGPCTSSKVGAPVLALYISHAADVLGRTHMICGLRHCWRCTSGTAACKSGLQRS